MQDPGADFLVFLNLTSQLNPDVMGAWAIYMSRIFGKCAW
jgi:hypothetical protein